MTPTTPPTEAEIAEIRKRHEDDRNNTSTHDAGLQRYHDITVLDRALTAERERTKAAMAGQAMLLEMAKGFDEDDRDYERINNLAGCENNHWRTQLREFLAGAPAAAAQFLARVEAMERALGPLVTEYDHRVASMPGVDVDKWDWMIGESEITWGDLRRAKDVWRWGGNDA